MNCAENTIFPEPQRSARELTLLWRGRLERARAAYDQAAEHFQRTARAVRSSETASREGANDALRRATEAEKQAREYYTRVLHAFTDLVINGNVPPDLDPN